MTETPAIEGTVVDEELLSGDPVLDKLMSFFGNGTTSPKMKLFVFGEPGCGKTTLAGTTPKPLFVDVDKGAASVPHIANSDNHFTFRSVQQLEKIVEYLKMGVPQLDRFETVVIDTLTEVHKRGLTQVAIRNAKQDGRENNNQIIGSDHQENNERIRRLVSDIRDLDRHVVMTAHTKYVKEKGDEGITSYMPEFSDKLANTVNAVFDIVAYMKQETEMDGTTAAVMTIRSSGAHKVKTRIKTMPSTLVNPTWDKLYNKYVEFLNSGEVNG